MLRRTFCRRYFHDIRPEQYPAQGQLTPRFQSAKNPIQRRSILTSLALSPHTLRDEEIPILTLGSAMEYGALTKYRIPIREGVTRLLGVAPESLKLSLLRPLRRVQGHGQDLIVRCDPHPRDREKNYLNKEGRAVVVRTMFDVLVDTEVAPDMEAQATLAAMLWEMVEEGTSPELTTYGIGYCEVPPPESDYFFDRVLGITLSQEDIDNIQNAEHRKMLEVELWENL